MVIQFFKFWLTEINTAYGLSISLGLVRNPRFLRKKPRKMQPQLMNMDLTIAASLYPVVAMGGQVEGHETNVVVLECEINRDDKPHDIYVYAVAATQQAIQCQLLRNECPLFLLRLRFTHVPNYFSCASSLPIVSVLKVTGGPKSHGQR